jgi:hypothetical protein
MYSANMARMWNTLTSPSQKRAISVCSDFDADALLRAPSTPTTSTSSSPLGKYLTVCNSSLLILYQPPAPTRLPHRRAHPRLVRA